MSKMVRFFAPVLALAVHAFAFAAPAALADQERRDKRPRVERERSEDRREIRRPHRADQDFAFQAMRRGEIMALSEIEARIIPHMRGARYIGSTFDRDSAVYTLKFMREASVIWVDVDGRSGRIIGR